ncbi:1,2-dihydroxy-3-keto-5-methylthiopentene dioxygenase [Actinokineospora globicatena]|uniref:1,2-dihydroxy-3-keto-5-methylthiopentene dioxygenase n=1 Tax=Actinokineospora globicatena TaxID=103729 RepID=UPI0020A51C59|nr:cupin [Actinokineospora globicatena]MCP2306379.1 acireductone dioxygenase apoprotein [Actinokineospora globicatena]GLW81806.1 acireductone dioxygenase [Actinokineospora globicatena]GLW88600.1 acireductone dioxygenase [Actinokineospora globicatena]
MTQLTIWADDDPGTVLTRTRDAAEITDTLGALGVRFSRWPLVDLPAEPTSDEVIKAYQTHVDEVSTREGYHFVDAVTMVPADTDEWRATAATARAKFLAEHTHDDDEDRFFARGSGIFYLHIAGKVHAVLCEAGDLLSVPADTTHWFDMGTHPEYVSIRFFHDDDGWIATFLDNSIAHHFPTYDEITAQP